MAPRACAPWGLALGLAGRPWGLPAALEVAGRPGACRRPFLRAAGEVVAGAAGRRTVIVVPSPIRDVAVDRALRGRRRSRARRTARDPGRSPAAGGAAGCRPRTSSDRSSAAMPSPWSRTSTTAKPPERRTATFTLLDPTGVLDGVRQQVQEDLLEAAGVATHDQRSGGFAVSLIVGAVGEPQPRCPSRLLHDRHQVDRLDSRSRGGPPDPAHVEQPVRRSPIGAPGAARDAYSPTK